MAEISRVVGPDGASAFARRLSAAAGAYERDRYRDAYRTTKSLVAQAPGSSAARELHGLVCYRLGRWREAITHLTAAAQLGGEDPSHLPAVMDCHRALGHHRRVSELWETLRRASPPPDVLAEGRMVIAADLADRQDLQGAMALLAGAAPWRLHRRRPQLRDIRQWYLLADLYERAGDMAQARELFARVVAADPELADARSRLASLGAPAARRGGRRRPAGA